jgi:hypothetical protein
LTKNLSAYSLTPYKTTKHIHSFSKISKVKNPQHFKRALPCFEFNIGYT